MKVNRIPVRVYRAEVFVFIGKREELLRYANVHSDEFPKLAEYIQEDIDSCVTSAAETYYSDNTNIIRIEKFPNTPILIGDLNHELLHAIFNILNNVNVEYDVKGSNEAFTYLMSYLSEEAYEKSYYEEVTYEKVE